MDKQLSFRIDKLYDFKDKEAQKYAVLAYFKEQEKAKNNILNAAATQDNNTPADTPAFSPRRISDIQPAPTRQPDTTPHGGFVIKGFTFSDLMLCIIAFLLFLILVTH